MKLENEKRCLEIIDQALKRLIAPAILMAFSLYALDIAFAAYNGPVISFLAIIYYILLLGLALLYTISVWNVSYHDFMEIEESNSDVQIYVWILGACYLLSIIVAAITLVSKLTN